MMLGRYALAALADCSATTGVAITGVAIIDTAAQKNQYRHGPRIFRAPLGTLLVITSLTNREFFTSISHYFAEPLFGVAGLFRWSFRRFLVTVDVLGQHFVVKL